MAKRYRSEALAALHETMAEFRKAGAISAERMRQYDDMCLDQPAGKRPQGATYVISKDADGGWRWQLVAANGRVIAISGEGFATKAECRSSIEQIRQLAAATVAA